MTPADDHDLREVHLLALPVPLWMRVQEHADELLREFALIAQQLAEPAKEDHIPVRLTALVAEVSGRYAGLTVEQENLLAAAGREGLPAIDDLVFAVPAHAGEAAGQLDVLLDEADEYCRAGRHLLTLAASDEVRRFRHWYLGEFVRQLAGATPVPWPRYRP